MFRLPNPLKIFLLMIACLAPQKIWAGQVDTSSIRKILGTENPAPPAQADDETSKKRLDRIAEWETTHLDPYNKNWNVSSPKWKPVYDRIHADLESEPNAITTLQTSTMKMQQAYEADLASHLSQSDVDSILAYYGTSDGQRYRDFIRRIDEIMLSGVVLSRSKEDVPSTVAQLAPERRKQYARMLLLSHLAQSIMAQVEIAQAAGQDTSASTILQIFMITAINRKQHELEILGKEYENDLSGFEAFSKSEGAHHFFTAMEPAMSRSAKDNPSSNLIKAVEQKHSSEWKALYQAQIKDD